ncbi:hypothetical protein [Sporosarcina sp. FSL K6-3457]|uniref:hypothetical protein n=1 Tax=Sporosarcina sp. FSL K6-3457 TaxID=2978204 RepID=UPI0030F512E1
MRTLQSEIVRNGLLQACTGEVERKNTKSRDKPKERLSRRELEGLMGVRRDTYKRGPGGAFRRR